MSGGGPWRWRNVRWRTLKSSCTMSINRTADDSTNQKDICTLTDNPMLEIDHNHTISKYKPFEKKTKVISLT